VYLDDTLVFFGISQYDTGRGMSGPLADLPHGNFFLKPEFPINFIDTEKSIAILEGNIRLRIGGEFGYLRRLVMKRETAKINLEIMVGKEQYRFQKGIEIWEIHPDSERFIVGAMKQDSNFNTPSEYLLAMQNFHKESKSAQEIRLFDYLGLVGTASVPNMFIDEKPLSDEKIREVLSQPIVLNKLGRNLLTEADGTHEIEREVFISAPNLACYLDKLVLNKSPTDTDAYYIHSKSADQIIADNNRLWLTHLNRRNYKNRQQLERLWAP